MGNPFDKPQPFKSLGQKSHTDAHTNSDVDADRNAMHHTLGPGPNQAAPGNHDHIVSVLQCGPSGAQAIAAPIAFYNCNLWTPFITDTDTFEEVVAATSFRVKKPGLYRFDFTAMFRNDFGAAGIRGVGIIIDGIQQAGNYSAPIAGAADYVNSSTCTTKRLAIGSTFYFQVISGSGVAGTIHTYPYTQFTATRLGL